jgi:hypothetical protein
MSGMAQATGIQALARGARLLGRPDYLETARTALGAFETPPPVGVSVPAPGGRHYLMYSSQPSLRILNGWLQALTGLRDMATLGHDARARRIYRRGERAARRAVAGFDTGAWSLYSDHGLESTLGYHQLTTSFLANLCARTHRATWCTDERRFARYEREPPRVDVVPMRRLRAGSVATLRFTLSKVSHVHVAIVGMRGAVLRTDLELRRGPHALAWRPVRRGRYSIVIRAQGLSGPAGIERRLVRVLRRHPRRKGAKTTRPGGATSDR